MSDVPPAKDRPIQKLLPDDNPRNHLPLALWDHCSAQPPSYPSSGIASQQSVLHTALSLPTLHSLAPFLPVSLAHLVPITAFPRPIDSQPSILTPPKLDNCRSYSGGLATAYLQSQATRLEVSALAVGAADAAKTTASGAATLLVC